MLPFLPGEFNIDWKAEKIRSYKFYIYGIIITYCLGGLFKLAQYLDKILGLN